jgi:DNA polymerase-3 subunit chi
MAEIRFYHLTHSTLEETLPALLEKTLIKDWRAVVRVSSAERAESLAQHLWAYRGDAFLPHGTRKDGFAEDQPIWITEREENPNGANVLFLADGAESADIAGFSLVCEIFDGGDSLALEKARAQWRTAKESGFDVSYWQQEARGWAKKA